MEVALVLRREPLEHRDDERYDLVKTCQTWEDAGNAVSTLISEGDSGEFMIVGGTVPDNTQWQTVTEKDIEDDQRAAGYMEKHGLPYQRLYPA